MKEYILDFAEDWAPKPVDERELEAFYAATVPAGGPALADIRDHVIAALERTKSPQVIAPSPPIELELLAALDEFLETRPSAMLGAHFWSATDAVAHLAKARTELTVIRDDELRTRLDQQLLAACDAIASVGAPVHFLERERRNPTFDEQVAALASVGIAARPGTTRDDLLRNYSEHDIEAQPWYRLVDLLELADGFEQFAAECIEYPGEDDDAYSRLVTRLAELAALPVTNVSSTIDWEHRRVSLAFELDGQRHEMKPDFGTYLDTDVFERIAELAAERGGPLLVWRDYSPTTGDYIVVATDVAGYQRLRAAGAPFSPIADRTSGRGP